MQVSISLDLKNKPSLPNTAVETIKKRSNGWKVEVEPITGVVILYPDTEARWVPTIENRFGDTKRRNEFITTVLEAKPMPRPTEDVMKYYGFDNIREFNAKLKRVVDYKYAFVEKGKSHLVIVWIRS